MKTNHQPGDPPSGSALPPGPQLSKLTLTAALLVVTAIPVSLALSVWYFIPAKPEHPLNVEVTYMPVTWPPEKTAEAQLVPGVRLFNPSPDEWSNISLAINKQFYFYYPARLRAGQSCDIPLFLFKTGGNQAFRPRSQTIKLLTVYAQMPNGGRAVYDGPGPTSDDSAGEKTLQPTPLSDSKPGT